MDPPIVRCRFPFPEQDPPVSMPEGCIGRCPRADAAVFAKHATISPDDPTLLATIRDFAAWFYLPGQSADSIDEQVRHAAILYTRDDHDGACIPKAVLFMHYKLLQYSSYSAPLQLSDAARRALKGKRISSWPDGEPAAGPTWNQMFYEYSQNYE